MVFAAYDGDLTQIDTETVEGKKDFVAAVAQVSRGIVHLHSLGMVHHDIKRKNVVYRKTQGGIVAAVCDFESICVPFIRDVQLQGLNWGPYAGTSARVCLQARIDQECVSDDSEIDEEAEQEALDAAFKRNFERYRRRRSLVDRNLCYILSAPRWEKNWDFTRWTPAYRA